MVHKWVETCQGYGHVQTLPLDPQAPSWASQPSQGPTPPLSQQCMTPGVPKRQTGLYYKVGYEVTAAPRGGCLAGPGSLAAG